MNSKQKHNIKQLQFMIEMACFDAVFGILKFQDASTLIFKFGFLGFIRSSRTVCCETFVHIIEKMTYKPTPCIKEVNDMSFPFRLSGLYVSVSI